MKKNEAEKSQEKRAEKHPVVADSKARTPSTSQPGSRKRYPVAKEEAKTISPTIRTSQLRNYTPDKGGDNNVEAMTGASKTHKVPGWIW